MSGDSGKRARRRPMSEINVVPYIDVMLVLLIIFMVTAPLLTEGVKVNLPQAAAKPLTNPSGKNPTNVILTVDAQGQYYLNIGENQKQPLKPKIVVARVAAVLQHNHDVRVLVKGDKDVPYERVLFGMTLLQAAGAPSVGLITKPPKNPQVKRVP
ncbi:MAG TPA: protein TolR [Gammaproteobacteria bacterium]|jgi:biopolymer transport protein TolR|nr:protein TolR [Gammaproteobacteria bacterium]